MRSIEWYKETYKNREEVYSDGRMLVLPIWLVALLLDKSGVQSKRKRQRKKAVKKELIKAIKLGMAVEGKER